MHGERQGGDTRVDEVGYEGRVRHENSSGKKKVEILEGLKTKNKCKVRISRNYVE